MVTRRKFIKSGCVACAGIAGLSALLEACSASMPMVKLVPQNDVLTVPAINFAEGKTMVVVRSRTLEDDILLVKTGDEYKALYLKCTHEGSNLTPTPTKIYCNAHGSVFDLSGNVLQEPASKPLRQFKTEHNEREILIHLT